MSAAASTDAFARFCCGDPHCVNACEREVPRCPPGCPKCAAEYLDAKERDDA